jgi:hypothetical protein
MARKHITRDIPKGNWVSFQTDAGESHRGHITEKHGRAVRIVDSQGKRYTTSRERRGEKIRFKSIRALQMGVFVLDTQLDKQWTSRRRGAVFWEEYCSHAGWRFAYERVHSLDDLRYILGNRVIQEHVLIFNGHGHRADGWQLSNGEKLDGNTSLKIHPKNRHKLIIFSSCEIGANARVCQALRQLFMAKAVIGYSSSVDDDFCFLVEPALLQLVANTEKSPADAVALVARQLDPWKFINKKGATMFPMRCHP